MRKSPPPGPYKPPFRASNPRNSGDIAAVQPGDPDQQRPITATQSKAGWDGYLDYSMLDTSPLGQDRKKLTLSL
jgi:hypothetical protein